MQSWARAVARLKNVSIGQIATLPFPRMLSLACDVRINAVSWTPRPRALIAQRGSCAAKCQSSAQGCHIDTSAGDGEQCAKWRLGTSGHRDLIGEGAKPTVGLIDLSSQRNLNPEIGCCPWHKAYVAHGVER